MERIGRKQEKSLRERKTSIPYDKIDKGILKTIRLLNKLPFCVTTSCCQGHATDVGSGCYTANYYITLEVTDENKFLEMLKEIIPDFEKITAIKLNIQKEYFFNEDAKLNQFHWRLSFYWSRESVTEVEDIMLKGRKCLERLLLEYQGRHKDVLGYLPFKCNRKACLKPDGACIVCTSMVRGKNLCPYFRGVLNE